jgi:hypothetical protein
MRLEKAATIRVIRQEPAFSEMFIAISLAAPSASKQTSLTSCSIRVRNGSPGCSCCWRTSVRKTNQNR